MCVNYSGHLTLYEAGALIPSFDKVGELKTCGYGLQEQVAAGCTMHPFSLIISGYTQLSSNPKIPHSLFLPHSLTLFYSSLPHISLTETQISSALHILFNVSF